MRVPKIQAVCGFGCGSSLMLRMAIDKIASQHGIEINSFCGDVGSCCANPCDVIFISRELYERIRDRATVPVVVIDNFMDKAEVERKTLEYLTSISEGNDL